MTPKKMTILHSHTKVASIACGGRDLDFVKRLCVAWQSILDSVRQRYPRIIPAIESGNSILLIAKFGRWAC